MVSDSTLSEASAEIMTRSKVTDFLYHEAELLDRRDLEAWLSLYTDDAVLWVPIDESKPVETNVSILYESKLRLEERVYRLLHTSFPSQNPPSRTVHFISNVRIRSDSEVLVVRSNQLVYEMRTGDPSQVGLGEPRPLVCEVEHVLVARGDGYAIREKNIFLVDRDVAQRNLTFLF